MFHSLSFLRDGDASYLSDGSGVSKRTFEFQDRSKIIYEFNTLSQYNYHDKDTIQLITPNGSILDDVIVGSLKRRTVMDYGQYFILRYYQNKIYITSPSTSETIIIDLSSFNKDTENEASVMVSMKQKNTWDTWHLVPTKRPVIVPPTQKRQIIDIPGGDGVLDVSLALTGYPVYNNREGTIEFAVVNNNNYDTSIIIPEQLTIKDWTKVLSDIQEYFSGSTMLCILEDEPEYYYRGLWWVDSWNNNEMGATITLGYSVEPYKFSYGSSTGKWLWNPFNFQTGIIYSKIWSNITFNNKVTKTFKSDTFGSKPVSPKFIVINNGRTVNCHFVNPKLGIDKTIPFSSSGTWENPEIVIYGDEVTFEFWNSYTGGSDSVVSIDFIPGRL